VLACFCDGLLRCATIGAVSPFRRNRPPAPTDEERQAAEVDLERIRQGGIPLGAEERLKRIASASTPFFTSDLSAKEYALAQASGLQPVAQVMGSSVVQHGWMGNQAGYYMTLGEVPTMSEPWNLARDRAFDRLRQEAQFAGADAVIGIEIGGGSLAGPGNAELVVFGTAVRDNAFARRGSGQVRTCTLSGQDVDKLRRIGAETVGVVGQTTVVCVQLRPGSNYVVNSSGWLGGAGARNTEVPEITQGVYEARRLAMAQVRRQASEAGANNIVISTLRHAIEHREYERMGARYNYFYVTMNVLGTAIRLAAHDPHPAPISGPLMAINLGDQNL
jgi:uncharacterized protein YbjQ (UPF0145 family)